MHNAGAIREKALEEVTLDDLHSLTNLHLAAALFHALGYPANELAIVRTPGDVLPVNTERPGYLPPVGNGPPPATRPTPLQGPTGIPVR